MLFGIYINTKYLIITKYIDILTTNNNLVRVVMEDN